MVKLSEFMLLLAVLNVDIHCRMVYRPLLIQYALILKRKYEKSDRKIISYIVHRRIKQYERR